ncbi:MAG: hypothetical protein IJ637_07880 [Prevotella sp.]|nr:hypothetical protein [Prevotella sp.]
MKKTYTTPAIEVVCTETEQMLAASAISELIDNTDAATVDDFNQLSREMADEVNSLLSE